jgi:hypothetical protein
VVGEVVQAQHALVGDRAQHPPGVRRVPERGHRGGVHAGLHEGDRRPGVVDDVDRAVPGAGQRRARRHEALEQAGHVQVTGHPEDRRQQVALAAVRQRPVGTTRPVEAARLAPTLVVLTHRTSPDWHGTTVKGPRT